MQTSSVISRQGTFVRSAGVTRFLPMLAAGVTGLRFAPFKSSPTVLTTRRYKRAIIFLCNWLFETIIWLQSLDRQYVSVDGWMNHVGWFLWCWRLRGFHVNKIFQLDMTAWTVVIVWEARRWRGPWYTTLSHFRYQLSILWGKLRLILLLRHCVRPGYGSATIAHVPSREPLLTALPAHAFAVINDLRVNRLRNHRLLIGWVNLALYHLFFALPLN